MNEKPTQEYGWRLIETAEQKARLGWKRPGDQLWETKVGKPHWVPCYPLGVFVPDFTYRRRIDPGEGWEIVPGDQSDFHGDDYTLDGENWFPVQGNLRATGATCLSWLTCHYLAFRRRKVAPAPHAPELDAKAADAAAGKALTWEMLDNARKDFTAALTTLGHTLGPERVPDEAVELMRAARNSGEQMRRFLELANLPPAIAERVDSLADTISRHAIAHYVACSRRKA